VNEQLPDERPLEKSPQTVLFGKNGRLDSLGLVSFIVEVEQELEDEFGIAVTLADERAMSQKNSPFLTLQTLEEYISLLLRDHDVTING
jgi:acyl carrier protein